MMSWAKGRVESRNTLNFSSSPEFWLLSISIQMAQMLKDQIWLFLPSSELRVQKPGSSPAYAIDYVIQDQLRFLVVLKFSHLQNEEHG